MRAKIKFLCIALVLALAATAFSQQQPPRPFIDVGNNILVSAAQDGHPLVEPQLTSNPENPKHLLAVAIAATNPPFSAEQDDCSAFVSMDGGTTWSRHNFGLKGCGDPWVTLRVDGTALFAALLGGRIAFLYSTDGGRNWLPSTADLDGGHDHPTMVADAHSDRLKGSIYLVSNKLQRDKSGRLIGSVLTAKSSDGGKSFPQTTYVVPSNLNFNSLTPAVLTDGTLVVPFIDFQRNVDDFGGAGRLERNRVWSLVSSDGGQTFSNPLFVSEACTGFASLSADNSSGPFRDRLYLTCMGRERDRIFVHSSADRGERWSDPVRVDSPADNAVFRRTASIAVNKDGVVGVTWYDRRKESGRECQYIAFSASLDGGKTFVPEVRVSTVPSCPDTKQNGAVAQRWPAGGDYSGLVATSDGLFHVLWSDSRSGVYELWTASIRVNHEMRERELR